MLAAAIPGRVGGPPYLSGSSLGIAGAAASLGAAASVERDADEQAPSATADHASTDKEDFMITPWKSGLGNRAGPGHGKRETGNGKRETGNGTPRGASVPGFLFPCVLRFPLPSSVLTLRPTRQLSTLENPGR